MRYGPLFLMTIVLFSSGCIKVGHDFVPPEAPVADSWLPSEEEKLSPEPNTFRTWWPVFNDPVSPAWAMTSAGQTLD